MAKIHFRKKICLITPGHLASDPRLVKEAAALYKAGYAVHVIFTQYLAYLADHDGHILKNNPGWTWECLDWTGASAQSKITRFLSRAVRLLIRRDEVRLNRNYYWQRRAAIAQDADLYIAHNLGALSVAVNAAKKNEAKCGFDAEDFHRFEESDDLSSSNVQLKIRTENKFIPQLDYLTTSSPMINAHYAGLYAITPHPIINSFPKFSSGKLRNNKNSPLRLFWFSQTVGPGRGLEIILQAIARSNVTVELHLLGSLYLGYEQQLRMAAGEIPGKPFLFVHSPVYADRLVEVASGFDIGIAAESSTPLNRDICLTNKLFTYLQAGLAVVASATSAQAAFMEEHKGIGYTYQSLEELIAILRRYDQNRTLLYETRYTCHDLGQTVLNWENESQVLLGIIKEVVD